MKTLRILTVALSFVLLVGLLVNHANGEFRIIGTNTASPPNAFGGPRTPPDANAIFKHWDLREFPDCRVPYSYYNSTADTGCPGTTAFDMCDAGFAAWDAVTPARISFVRVLPSAGALCPLHRDGNNMLGWNSFGCGNPGDDACLPGGGCACWAAVAANADIVSPGGDGWLQTSPNNCCDDRSFMIGPDTMVIVDGGNGRSESPRLGDDVVILGASVACGGAVADTLVAGSGIYMVITKGPNNVWDTQAQSCCDDQIYFNVGASEYRIRDGGNGRVTTVPNDITALTPGTYALTGIFSEFTTGRILEADILFNDFYNWCNCPNDDATNPPTADVQGTATHEIGHWLGIHHPQWPNVAAADGADGITPTMYATGTPFDGNNFDRTLENDDRDALNFLYNPDLGDAPDPFTGAGMYPSLVHGSGPGRVLNGITLTDRGPGAEHIFGIKPLQARNFTYEWIGDNLTSECESNQVNADPNDDGTVLVPNPAVRGAGFAVTVRINTNADAYGRAHNYAQRPMYLNIWADWNGNGIFEPGPPEQLAGPGDAIRLPGLYTRGGTVPPGAAPVVWIRTRLDWGEDCGAVQNRDLTLNGPRGAAQFGEVQDTLVPVIDDQRSRYDLGDIDPCNYPTLPDNPANAVSGCVWLGGCITAEVTPNFYNLDPCDDGVFFNGLPWTPCTPVSITVYVNAPPPPSDCYTKPMFFNFWKDGNLDRDFCDVFCNGAAPEWAVQNVVVTASGSPYTFVFMDPGPYPFSPYSLVARARLTSVPLTPVFSPVGPCDSTCWWAPAIDEYGEVEDYVLPQMQLSVNLTSFDVVTEENGVAATWVTASETANDHFELLRDGSVITSVPTQGNDASGHHYHFVDEHVSVGRTYTFTLATIDQTGHREDIAQRTLAVTSMPSVVTEYALHQNYPNPFNPVTNIRFDLLSSGYVTLKVYNVSGQEVSTIVRGNFDQGAHVVTFDGASLPSGVYWYRLETAGFVDTKKMLLLK